MIVVALLTVAGGGLRLLSQPEVELDRKPLAELSTLIERRRSEDLALDPKVVSVLGVDDYINRIYAGRGNAFPISLYVGYYGSQRTGATIHSPMKCLPGTGWQPIETAVRNISVREANGAEKTVRVNRYLVQKGLNYHVVLFWYQMHGQVVASEYAMKALTIATAVRANRTDGALVRIIVPVGANGDTATADAAAAEFARGLFPFLGAHLPI
jgi:EpsI family protein